MTWVDVAFLFAGVTLGVALVGLLRAAHQDTCAMCDAMDAWLEQQHKQQGGES